MSLVVNTIEQRHLVLAAAAERNAHAHRLAEIVRLQRFAYEEHATMMVLRSDGPAVAATEAQLSARWWYERARTKLGRAFASEYTWADGMSEDDVGDFPAGCKITITARQLDELLRDAHLDHAD